MLATEPQLTVVVNGEQRCADLRENFEFNAGDLVTVDDYEVLPKYSYMAENGVLRITEPFYVWLHKASGQGWLLMPQ